jgi:hypothetical protein
MRSSPRGKSIGKSRRTGKSSRRGKRSRRGKSSRRGNISRRGKSRRRSTFVGGDGQTYTQCNGFGYKGFSSPVQSMYGRLPAYSSYDAGPQSRV